MIGYLSPSKTTKLKSLVKDSETLKPILRIMLTEKASQIRDNVSLSPPQKAKCSNQAQVIKATVEGPAWTERRWLLRLVNS